MQCSTALDTTEAYTRYYESPELRFNQWPETDYYYKWQPQLRRCAPQPVKQQPDARPFGENDRVWVLINRLQERRLCRVDLFHEMLAGEGFQLVERWHYGDALVGLYEKGKPVAGAFGRVLSAGSGALALLASKME